MCHVHGLRDRLTFRIKIPRLSSTSDTDEFYLLKKFFGGGIIRVSLEIFELEIDKSKDSKDGSFLFPFQSLLCTYRFHSYNVFLSFFYFELECQNTVSLPRTCLFSSFSRIIVIFYLISLV